MGPVRQYSTHAVVALLSLLLFVACSDSFSDAYCDAGRKDNQQALDLLTHVLERKRNHTGIYLARARCFYYVGSYDRAVQDATEVIHRLPNKADAYLIRAKAEEMLRQVSQALDDYSASIRLRPSAEAYYGRGLIYVREYQEKEREALEDLTAAIRYDAQLVGAYHSRADIYLRRGHFQQALEDYQQVLKLDPSTPHIYCNVGIAHYALGHETEGSKSLTLCYQKGPDARTREYYEEEIRKVIGARQPS